jgi:ribulose-5-phosphate 4-epimerase/fuculose-1-phosphate aldolase
MKKLYQVGYYIAITDKDHYRMENIKFQLRKYSRQAFSLGLVWGTSGNMSARADAGSFFITASGKSLGDISEKDLIQCRIDSDSADRKASMEWRLHSVIYNNVKDAKAVFHSQAPYSTLMACAKNKKLKTSLIPEAIAYLNKIEVVPYHHAGSADLAKKAGEYAKKADVLLLENHGVVTYGPSIEEAVNKTLTFEFLCKLTVLSNAACMELKEIPAGKADEFLRLLKGKA